MRGRCVEARPMPTLVLVRHGQSLWNLENRFTGWVDVPLTEKGETEARRAGEALAPLVRRAASERRVPGADRETDAALLRPLHRRRSAAGKERAGGRARQLEPQHRDAARPAHRRAGDRARARDRGSSRVRDGAGRRDRAVEAHPRLNLVAPPWEALARGADLFNRGLHWEAHEAWEELW